VPVNERPPQDGGPGELGDRLVVVLMWLGAIAILVGAALIVWGAVR
jgi:hypothetical protein